MRVVTDVVPSVSRLLNDKFVNFAATSADNRATDNVAATAANNENVSNVSGGSSNSSGENSFYSAVSSARPANAAVNEANIGSSDSLINIGGPDGTISAVGTSSSSLNKPKPTFGKPLEEDDRAARLKVCCLL